MCFAPRHVGLSTLRGSRARCHDVVDLRDERLLERRRERHRRVRRGEPHDGARRAARTPPRRWWPRSRRRSRAVRVSSCSTSSFEVCATDCQHGLAVPRHDRAQVEHLDRRCRRFEAPGRRRRARCSTIAPHVTIVRSSPSRCDARLAERRRVVAVGHLALDAAVEVLVLEVQHRVRVADRLDDQALGILGRRRADDLQAGDVRERATPGSASGTGRRRSRRRTGSAPRTAPACRRGSAAWRRRWRGGPSAQETKSANCISATGRMPMIAAPVQAPTIAVSASGASSTRHSPNSSWKPCVTLKAPPYTPTSSPITNTRSSRRISSRSPSRDRLQIGLDRSSVTCGAGCRVLRGSAQTPSRTSAGRAAGLASARSERLGEERFTSSRISRVLVVAEPSRFAFSHARKRSIGSTAPSVVQLPRHVERVVVDGVALAAERHAARAASAHRRARLLVAALRLAVHREHVGAVDDDALEAVARGAVGDVLVANSRWFGVE